MDELAPPDVASGLPTALRDAVAELSEGLPELAAAAHSDPAPLASGPAQLAAAGPLAGAHAAEYELLLELIREGYLLHYGTPRLYAGLDPDLALLFGDTLYAAGLARLSALGDLAAVGELADLISLVAQAELGAENELAEAVWTAGAVAIGWGTDAGLDAAKERARSRRGGASTALLAAAAARRTADGGAGGSRASGREGGNL